MNSYRIDVMPGPLYFHIKITEQSPADRNNRVWRFEAPKDQFAPVHPTSELHQISAFLEGEFWGRLSRGDV